LRVERQLKIVREVLKKVKCNEESLFAFGGEFFGNGDDGVFRKVDSGFDEVEDFIVEFDGWLVMNIGTGLFDEGIELFDFFHF